MVSRRKDGTAMPAFAASVRATASQSTVLISSLGLGNLAIVRCPSRSRTDALGRAPPRDEPGARSRRKLDRYQCPMRHARRRKADGAIRRAAESLLVPAVPRTVRLLFPQNAAHPNGLHRPPSAGSRFPGACAPSRPAFPQGGARHRARRRLPSGRALTQWLAEHCVTAAAMEATGIFWKAPWEPWRRPASSRSCCTRRSSSSCRDARATASAVPLSVYGIGAIPHQ